MDMKNAASLLGKKGGKARAKALTPERRSEIAAMGGSASKGVAKRLKRSPIKRHAPKRLPGYDDPEYRAWLRKWPCYVCLLEWCRKNRRKRVLDPISRALIQGLDFNFQCGPTEVAHVGLRGLRQRCKDREAMPLGTRHHMHPTVGGGPDSHHALGKKFWEHHGIDRKEVIELLNRLYHEETGK